MKLRNLETLAQGFSVITGAMQDIEFNGGVDHTITDPPYADRTQNNTRRGRMAKGQISEAMPLGFDHATTEKRRIWAERISTRTRRFALVFTDQESSMDWANHLETFGMEYIRCALWIRTGSYELTADRPIHSGAPQFTGDRPAAGHEVIVIAHQRRTNGGLRMRWNGGGKAAIYTAPVVPHGERLHSTQKPLALMHDILRDFCRPGESIFDPFAGSGTTLVAAKNLGMRACGIELDQKFADLAARRVTSAVVL